MSSIIRFLINHFTSTEVKDRQYIDIKPLIENYRKIRGNSRTTFTQFIQENELDFLVTKHNDDNAFELPLNLFHHKQYKILI